MGKWKEKCAREASTFAQQHYSHLALRVYNKLNLIYETKNLSNFKIKQKIKLWLKELELKMLKPFTNSKIVKT